MSGNYEAKHCPTWESWQNCVRGRIATLVMLMWCVTLVGCGLSARRSTDPDFILRVNSMSPNGELRLLEYQYDIGALGYSRTWWAVTPPRFEGLDLTPYEMPYGYMAVGWSPANELLVESWKPYYYSDCTLAFSGITMQLCTPPTLSTGDLFQGARVVVTARKELASLSQAPTTRKLLNAQWGAVFPPASAGQLLRQCSRTPTPIQGTWNPSPDQVRLLEGPLSVLLDHQLSALRLPDSLRPHAGDYYRQYAGVIVGGRRIIYVNGFHKTQVAETRTFLTEHRNDSAALRNFPSAFRDSDYWRGVATMVCDGGEYYFGVEYDPETHRFRNFSFNGR